MTFRDMTAAGPAVSPVSARVRRWFAEHPLVLDVLIAVGVLGVTLLGAVTVSHYPKGPLAGTQRDLPVHTAVIALLASASLVWRRRFPMWVLAATIGLGVLELALGTASHGPADRTSAIMMPAAVALFTMGMRTDRRTTWRVGVIAVSAITAGAMVLGPQPWYVAENLGTLAWSALAAAVGEAVRSRRAELDAVRERAERAERTREEEARRRVAEERMRIARELHDVVAHHIALVNVQAGVASHVMDGRPDQAKEALAHVREASRQALNELQTTVGLLRQKGEPVAPTEPARGLGVLDELVEGFTRTGLRITVDAPAAAEPLPSAVDLAAYRVVQEALTNVRKHAGGDATARVRIERSGGAAGRDLRITVRDDGRAPAGPVPGTAPGEGGHGLTGMRERAEALGGTCVAGSSPDGGFLVDVTLPLCPPRPEEEGEDGGAAVPARRRCR